MVGDAFFDEVHECKVIGAEGFVRAQATCMEGIRGRVWGESCFPVNFRVFMGAFKGIENIGVIHYQSW